MSKGIAIRTILYLLLGVLVVGILIYMVYTYGTGPGLDIQDCRSQIQNWCNGCMIAGWQAGIGEEDEDSDIGTCIKSYFASGNFGTNWPINCYKTSGGTDGETELFCEQFTG